jgi:dolichol kinase
MAALFGKRYGSTQLFEKKTLEGSLAFSATFFLSMLTIDSFDGKSSPLGLVSLGLISLLCSLA